MDPSSTSQNKTITRKEWNRQSYGTALVNAIQDTIDPEKIQHTLAEMLEATIVTKGGNVRPDYRTREKALTLLLNYTVGTPVQRQEQVNYNVDMSELDNEQLIDKLANSPAMLDKVQQMLDQARAMSK